MSKVFFNSNGKVIMEDGKVILCDECPCDCTPLTIGTATLVYDEDDYESSCWDLTPYQDWANLEYVGSSWRLIETGGDEVYASGVVNNQGQLVGLPPEFCAKYTYPGYMALQVACIMPDGSEKFPED